MSNPITQIDDDREWVQWWIEDEEWWQDEDQWRRDMWPGYIEQNIGTMNTPSASGCNHVGVINDSIVQNPANRTGRCVRGGTKGRVALVHEEL